jgi:hypothetical protein
MMKCKQIEISKLAEFFHEFGANIKLTKKCEMKKVMIETNKGGSHD